MINTTMHIIRKFLVFLLAVGTASPQTNGGWKLVWSDEFNSLAGTPLDPTKWNYDLGGGGWGNGEAEVYTSSPANVFQDGKGNLLIRAIRDASGKYTSTRLQTGVLALRHTRPTSIDNTAGLRARIKLPFEQGVWPAFLDAGREHRFCRVARLWRVRHHGELCLHQ